MVNLSLEHGNSDAACFTYVWFAIIAGPRFGNYRDGFRFGRLGYELVEKRGLTRYQARTYMSFGNIVMPWGKHALGGRDLVRRAFDAAYRIGDLTFAAYSCNELITNFLTVGDPLAEVQPEAENGLAFAKNARFGLVIDIIIAQLQLIRTLRGLTPKFGCFNDEEFDELQFERHLASNPVLGLPKFWYLARKVQARFLAGDYASAVDASLNTQRLLWTSPSQFETAEFRFYGALSHAASWDSASPDQRQQHFDALATHHRQLEIWAENCPENFENRAALVGAEIARIEGRALDAEHLYEQAIRSAQANGFVHNEALAYEVAARFYAARGFDKIAHAYLHEARYGYLRWGADGKVRQLDQLYPQLTEEKPLAGPTSTIGTPVEHLDLATVIKVSQAVSGEIVLEKMIDTLMRTAIEHAGAVRGLLILPRDNEQRIEAEATISGDSVIVRRREAAASALPESIIQFVARTHESVILDDASAESPFLADPYIAQTRAHSILCLPLINQGKLVGVLYLENNLAACVFAPARIAVLKLLASQAATSLENAHLYRDVAEREAKIRRLVDANIVGIFIWDLEGQILEANDAFLRIVGYDREDLASGRLRWTDLTPPEWLDRDLQQFVPELKMSGILQPFEKEYFRKDGSRVPVLIGVAAFDKECNQGVAFVLDLTERKVAEETLRKALLEVEQLKNRLQAENIYLQEEIKTEYNFEEIIGQSTALQKVLRKVEQVAPTESTVLIQGETGTGKELVARAIHNLSPRKDRPLVKVNCPALPAGLIESELFGHEKGAFTGALSHKVGRFELANDGTIFLDEIGDLPLELQAKLLRVLQEGEFERVGGSRTIKVDIRVIAATNRDLKKAMEEGKFRPDLYYRLNVFPILIPPLRERKEDILGLVRYFAMKYGTKLGKKVETIPQETMDALMAYSWPGNVRELENTIERAIILAHSSVIQIDESLEVRLDTGLPTSGSGTLEDIEWAYILRVLDETNWVIQGKQGAASVLGLEPSTLRSRMKKLGIKRPGRSI
jgi:PAS domain S-box-containing protein